MADERDRAERAQPEANAPEPEAAPRAAARRAARRAPRARAARRADGDKAPAPRARARRAPRARAAEADAPAEEAPADEAPAARRPARRAAPRRREADERPARPVVVRAQAKYVRSSARKARLVCDHIRGKSVEEARAILAFTPRAVARDWSKVLESAVANAEHNNDLDGEDLIVKAAHADEGPTLKRFRPRAMGRATPIRKRTSHLTILLAPKE
jgi:ribosomal protein L22